MDCESGGQPFRRRRSGNPTTERLAKLDTEISQVTTVARTGLSAEYSSCLIVRVDGSTQPKPIQQASVQEALTMGTELAKTTQRPEWHALITTVRVERCSI